MNRHGLLRCAPARTILLLVPALACSQDSESAPESLEDLRMEEFDSESVLEFLEEFRIEESDEALVQAPRMVADPLGGWLYWDVQANQVRLLAPDGALRQVFGGPGDGPGEFNDLRGVTRVGDGRLVTLDGRGRVAVWTESGDSVLSDFMSGITRTDGLTAAGRNRIAILADPNPIPMFADPAEPVASGPSVSVLHFLNLDSRTVDASVLQPHITVENLAAMVTFRKPDPVVRDGLVFVAIPPFDTLWATPIDGRGDQRAIHLESSGLNSNPPPVPESAGVSAFMSWAGLSTFVGRFFPMPDGGWVFQTWSMRSAAETPVGILRVNSAGHQLWEVSGTAELLAVDPSTGYLYLWDREGLDPGFVQVARERR